MRFLRPRTRAFLQELRSRGEPSPGSSVFLRCTHASAEEKNRAGQRGTVERKRADDGPRYGTREAAICNRVTQPFTYSRRSLRDSFALLARVDPSYARIDSRIEDSTMSSAKRSGNRCADRSIAANRGERRGGKAVERKGGRGRNGESPPLTASNIVRPAKA